MRSRSLAAQHDAAVARRLELLTTELAAVRGGEPPTGRTRPRTDPWVPRGHTRIRAVPDPDPEAEPPEEWVAGASPSVARPPGRHASRRDVAARWAELVPEGLRGRFALGAGHVAVLAVVAVVGLAATCWWLVRGSAHEVAAPVALVHPQAALTTPSGSGPATTSGSAVSASPATVVVDVTGRVRHPGIAVLRQGARVVDAIRAAGGARPGVDLGSLNLARVLTDGEQVVVGPGAAAVAGGPAGTSSLPSSGAPVTGPVNLNTADETALESLPEVGPVTAQAILAWRTQHGGFTSVDQLLDVDGIGDATLAQLRSYVTV